jgi:ABC-type nitrate/sulfonate/bicarbonate transport system permease component
LNIISIIWVDIIEAALITGAGFVLAFWYVRNRVVEKKSLSTSFLRYFQGLFPVGVMLFGVFVILALNPPIGALIMVISTFIYIVSTVTPGVDKYDSVHRATILSLGYTRQEYAVKYLFKNSINYWIMASANFFVAQAVTLIFSKDLIFFEKNSFVEDLFFASITLMVFGFILSLLRRFEVWKESDKE